MTNPLQECISPDDCEAIENRYTCEHRPSFWNLKKKNEHQEYLNISVIQFFAALGLAFIIKLVFDLLNVRILQFVLFNSAVYWFS